MTNASGSSFGNEEQTTPKASAPSKDIPKGGSKSTTQVSSSIATPRRSLLPAPKTATAPAGLKKEVQKDQESNRPAVSSPKKSAVTATKLHSPGHPKQRPATPKNGFSPKPGESRDAEKQLVQRLKEKCDEQSRQLSNIRDELKKASCGFDVFAITTQHFFRQAVWNSDFIDHVWLLWLDLRQSNCGTIKCFESIYNIRRNSPDKWK
ncbi:microtubule-associated tumor suppressor candidate 2 [Limosa lapponica baueri]|uniref:Microtubule-associated tumor suppressor candidate 2 n=1 Tax=Limosa lapponica baueri TaxID=1758121 RepID=A0A2I0U2U7_LIMLA|nr:microtubule-associated tumor suppressor candidate 2 [Limosa lapponica baueri]